MPVLGQHAGVGVPSGDRGAPAAGQPDGASRAGCSHQRAARRRTASPGAHGGGRLYGSRKWRPRATSSNAAGLASGCHRFLLYVGLGKHGNVAGSALLFLNPDEFAKRVRVRVPGLTGKLALRDGLSGKGLGEMGGEELARTGFQMELPARGPGVVLVERR